MASRDSSTLEGLLNCKVAFKQFLLVPRGELAQRHAVQRRWKLAQCLDQTLLFGILNTPKGLVFELLRDYLILTLAGSLGERNRSSSVASAVASTVAFGAADACVASSSARLTTLLTTGGTTLRFLDALMTSLLIRFFDFLVVGLVGAVATLTF
jgi:hypothetical protein